MANKSLGSTISLTKEEFSKLVEAYEKIGKILSFKKKKKTPPLESLYGIWKGVKVDEEDFERAKKSLFKTSL